MVTDVRASVWLPRGFEFLSGLPTAARKRRQILVIQAWIDDSGDKGQSGYLTLAGLMGEASEWADFSEEWSRRLKATPTIGYLSTSDAAGCNGFFGRFSPPQRDAKVSFLTRIANDFNFRLIAFSVDLAAFDEFHPFVEAAPPKRATRLLKAMFEHPYVFAFEGILLAACTDMLRRGRNEQFSLFIDEKKQLEWQIQAWYPALRHLLADIDKRIPPIAPSMPHFEDDQTNMPLQLADFVAYTWRAEQSGLAHPFVPILKRLKFTQAPATYFTADREYLRSLYAGIRDDETEPSAPDFLSLLRKTLGI